MEKKSSMDVKPCSHHHHRRHHHHHYHILNNFPLHSYMLQQGNKHVPACPLFTPSLQQSTAALLPDDLDVQISEPTVSYTDSRMTQNEGDDFEDEEEPIFVLTDEWRDFFAKS
ncbi:SKI/DACH domain-containing protein 1 [Capsicum chacoense]|uniref:SKI/DACH domain-containing protein 1 n=1 Tax=Capsicum annuum TaxID=4072 RepID=UPI0007BF2340|nr:SKI/DACH domain-containing protein 1 [Capsicum annuum]KAF3646440.1 putative peptidyl-prolyl cis-trans isomerase FKBP62-like isoform 1 [Capsicum annuum]